MMLVIKLRPETLKVLYQGTPLVEVPLSISGGSATVKLEFPSGTWPETVMAILGDGILGEIDNVSKGGTK